MSSGYGIEFIEQLVRLAGGNIVRREEQATIIISDTPIKSMITVVNDKWLFESIEQWKCKYLRVCLIRGVKLIFYCRPFN